MTYCVVQINCLPLPRFLKEVAIKTAEGRYEETWNSYLELLIVPIADKDSIAGARKLTQIIAANNRGIRGHYLLTKQSHTAISKQIKNLLMSQSSDNLYHTAIRQCEDLNKASAMCMSIFDFAPKSNGAEDYLSLATEIVGAKKDETLPF